MKRKSGRTVQTATVGLSALNYRLFGIAALVILAGYWALAQAPVDGFLTLTVAPILLVAGYCVLIPLAIMISKRTKATD